MSRLRLLVAAVLVVACLASVAEAQQVIVRNRGVFGRRQSVVVNNGFAASGFAGQQVIVQNRGFRRRNVVVNNFGFAQPAFVVQPQAVFVPQYFSPYAVGGYGVQSFSACGF